MRNIRKYFTLVKKRVVERKDIKSFNKNKYITWQKQTPLLLKKKESETTFILDLSTAVGLLTIPAPNPWQQPISANGITQGIWVKAKNQNPIEPPSYRFVTLYPSIGVEEEEKEDFLYFLDDGEKSGADWSRYCLCENYEPCEDPRSPEEISQEEKEQKYTGISAPSPIASP